MQRRGGVARSTSSRVTRPPSPVPVTCCKSTPCSRASFAPKATGGDACGRRLAGLPGVPARGCASGRPWRASPARAACARRRAALGGGAADAAESDLAERPDRDHSPSLTRIFVTTPASGAAARCRPCRSGSRRPVVLGDLLPDLHEPLADGALDHALAELGHSNRSAGHDSSGLRSRISTPAPPCRATTPLQTSRLRAEPATICFPNAPRAISFGRLGAQSADGGLPLRVVRLHDAPRWRTSKKWRSSATAATSCAWSRC